MAAAGDDDYGAILNDRRVKDRHILRIEGKVLWLLHDSAYYHSLKSPRTIRRINQDTPEPPDIVVFGHDHYSVVEYRRGILFINPGSPNSMGNASVPRTFAVLEIKSDKVEAKTLYL
jgi:putative phosphoesterase